MREPVVITGVGVLCGLGNDRKIVAEAVRRNERPFAPITRFDASSFRVNLAAQVKEPDFRGRFGRAILKQSSRTDLFALWAARDALAQADLPPAALAQTGVFVGASTGGVAEMEDFIMGNRAPSAATYLHYPVWSTTRILAHALSCGGPVATYMTACSSAAHALGRALQAVRGGELELAIAGGSEALTRLTLAGFGSLGVLDPDGTRPFDQNRQGITLGEGAAFFVLETERHAAARNAVPLARLAGYGCSADAHHMVHPREDGAGALLAMRAALIDAAIKPDDIDYVNAHGTGTLQNDAMEARAMQALFAGRTDVTVSSSKSMVGHTLGAAAAVEAALVVLGIVEGFVPGNPGVQKPMAELGPLQLLTSTQTGSPRAVLSSSFAFGGNNAVLVITRLDHPSKATATQARGVAITGGAVACSLGNFTRVAALADLQANTEPAHQSGFVGLDPGAVLGRQTIRRMDTLSQAVVAVSRQAIQGSGMTPGTDTGFALGTSFGNLDGTVSFLERISQKGPSLANPLDFPNLVHNAPAGHAACVLGLQGPNLTACEQELAGDEAVAAMATWIQSARLEAAICAGGDLASAWLDRGYQLLDGGSGSNPRHASVVGAVVLESIGQCQRRGATIWARVLGIGRAGTWGKVEAAVGRALEDASAQGLGPVAIDLWLTGATEAHGASHEATARRLSVLAGAERKDMRRILGDAAGSGPALLAIGAAYISAGKAATVLVTSVTRQGQAYATLLGAAT